MAETSKMITTAQKAPGGNAGSTAQLAYFFLGTPPSATRPDPEFIWGNVG
jgi:hypothetical protein